MKTQTLCALGLALVLLVQHASAQSAGAQDSATTAASGDKALVPAPGKVLRIDFPDLPPTLLAMTSGNNIPAAVLLRLPDNYNAEETFPLYVFVEGGNGGAGSNIGVPMRVSNGGDGVIVASFPLFKKKYDATQRWPFVVGVEDFQTLSSAYKSILDRIRQIIPNIDASRSIIGGHSNGAKAIAVLLSGLDENVLESFGGFFFIDGGEEWSSFNRPNTLGKHHILYLVGEGRESEAPSTWRKHILERVGYFRETARELGVATWRFERFSGVGHEFAEVYFDELRAWAAGVGARDDS